MRCPFCGNDMKKGIIKGDGRTKVRFVEEGKKVSLADELAGKGLIDARYKMAYFVIEADYCVSCKKMIFDTEIGN